MRYPLAAVTGGTGFIGRHVARALSVRGWRMRLLVRRTPLPAPLVELEPEIVLGDIEDDRALRELMHGADAVIHAAGLVRAASGRDYFRANASGSERVARVVRREAPGTRFIVVSSLAARAPQLSAYAASKRAGEEAALAACGPTLAAVLRPTAVYGPWDRETLRVFRAARGLLVLPAESGRISLVHAEDVAAAIVALAEDRALRGTFEITDSRRTGYSWDEIAAAVAGALGFRPRVLRVPGAVLRCGAPLLHVARLTRRPAMLTPGKLREILHDDWSSTPAAQLPPSMWKPKIGLDSGFSRTAQWYRDNGWMAPIAPSR